MRFTHNKILTSFEDQLFMIIKLCFYFYLVYKLIDRITIIGLKHNKETYFSYRYFLNKKIN